MAKMLDRRLRITSSLRCVDQFVARRELAPQHICWVASSGPGVAFHRRHHCDGRGEIVNRWRQSCLICTMKTSSSDHSPGKSVTSRPAVSTRRGDDVSASSPLSPSVNSESSFFASIQLTAIRPNAIDQPAGMRIHPTGWNMESSNGRSRMHNFLIRISNTT